MNKCFVRCMILHGIYTSVIIGCMGYRLSQSFSLSVLSLWTGWVISMSMVAFSGQRLIIESISVGDCIYNFPWYNLDYKFQKNLIPVLMICQKPIFLDVSPFGAMNYNFVFTILKTSYSYITLLKNTNPH